MYPTDEIYPVIFNFTGTDSPIEHFEELGYEGANYIEMSGSLLINIFIAVSASVFMKLLEKACIKLYTNQKARIIGSKIENSNFLTALLMAHMQGFLELSICIIVSNLEPTGEVYSSGNISNIFSTTFSMFSIMILAVMFVFIWLPLRYGDTTSKYKILT